MTDLFDFLLNYQLADWVGLALKITLAYFCVLWAAMVVWVGRDSVARTRSLLAQLLAILAVVLLNLFGLLIYLILRPQKTLLEKYYEEAERRSLSEPVVTCGACGHDLPLDFRFCPSCGVQARHACVRCKKLVGDNWRVCAHCGTAVEQTKKAAAAEKPDAEKHDKKIKSAAKK